MTSEVCANVRMHTFEHLATSVSPGPGAYEAAAPPAVGMQPDSRRPTAPRWSFGGARRNGEGRGGSSSPGPNQYDVPTFTAVRQRADSTKPDAAVAKFGKAPRDASHVNQNPGPNSYETPSSFARSGSRPASADSRRRASPAFSFGSSFRRPSSASGTPGPGQYVLEEPVGKAILSTHHSPAGMKFGSSGRSAVSRSDAPGPGAYTVEGGAIGNQTDSRRKSAPGIVFGSSARPSTAPSNSTPGPNAYAPVPERRRQGAVLGKDSRFKSGPRANEVPGPGAYAPESARERGRGGWSFGSSIRTRPERNSQSPGPGAYSGAADGDKALSNVVGTPGMVFGSSKRDVAVKHDGPAPGQYSPEAHGPRRGGGWSFGTGKRDSSADRGQTPAPNAYDAVPRTSRSGGFKFGTSRRDGGTRSITPGPGSAPASTTNLLSTHHRNGTVKFGTAARFGTTTRSDSPGPAAYDSSPRRSGSPAFTMRPR